MKRWSIFATMLLLIATPFLVWAQGGNLVINPGFETGDLTGWGSNGSVSVVLDPIHAGSYSLRLASSDAFVAQGSYEFIGSTLFVSGWVYSEDVSHVYITDGGNSCEEFIYPILQGTWEFFSDSWDWSGCSPEVAILLYGGSTGSAFFDDIYMGNSEAPTPAPTVVATSSPPATPMAINFDVDQMLDYSGLFVNGLMPLILLLAGLGLGFWVVNRIIRALRDRR